MHEYTLQGGGGDIKFIHFPLMKKKTIIIMTPRQRFKYGIVAQKRRRLLLQLVHTLIISMMWNSQQMENL